MIRCKSGCCLNTVYYDVDCNAVWGFVSKTVNFDASLFLLMKASRSVELAAPSKTLCTALQQLSPHFTVSNTSFIASKMFQNIKPLRLEGGGIPSFFLVLFCFFFFLFSVLGADAKPAELMSPLMDVGSRWWDSVVLCAHGENKNAASPPTFQFPPALKNDLRLEPKQQRKNKKPNRSVSPQRSDCLLREWRRVTA